MMVYHVCVTRDVTSTLLLHRARETQRRETTPKGATTERDCADAEDTSKLRKRRKQTPRKRQQYEVSKRKKEREKV